MDIKRFLLKEQLQHQKHATFKVVGTIGTAEDYLKWITYIPTHWHVEEILDKKANELTEEELSILRFIQKENEVKPAFEDFTSNEKPTSKSALEVYDYMKSISIEKYASLKLTIEEHEYCYNQIRLLAERNIEEAIETLSNQESSNICDSYILYSLRKVLSTINSKKLDKEIKKSTDEFKEDVIKELSIRHGYYYSNPYQKCR